MRGTVTTAAAVCFATAAAGARPAGLPVEIVDTFNQFTPGLALPQQAAVPGCPLWNGSGIAVLRAGSASDVVVRSQAGANTFARTRLTIGVFADESTDVSARAEMFVASLASTASVRLTHLAGGFTQSAAAWGGSIALTQCEGPARGVVTSTFVVTEPCAGFTSAAWVDTSVPVPVGAWFRLEQRTNLDGVQTWTLDPMDGSTPVTLSSSLGTFLGAALDEVRFSHTPSGGNDAMFVDNVRIAGLSTRPACPGDATRNGAVNFADLNEVLSAFGQIGGGNAIPADVNGDGVVNFTDLNAVLSAFGTACGCTP